MASILPFNYIKAVSGATIEADEFVAGRGDLTLNGTDTEVTTADGQMHNVRMALEGSAVALAFGDKTDFEDDATTNTDLSSIAVMELRFKTSGSDVLVYSGKGIIGAQYSAERNVTQLTLKFDSTIA